MRRLGTLWLVLACVGCGRVHYDPLDSGLDAPARDAPGEADAPGIDAPALDAGRCGVDQRVQSNACVACPLGTTNAAGDDPSMADTLCDDACALAFGLSCAELEEGYIKASNPGLDDQFGYSVALSGDTLAVGALHEGSAARGIDGDQSSDAAPQSGAVYVFTRSAGVWSQQAYLKASNADAGDWFGYAVALDGDTLAVSAPREDSAATGIGGDQASNAASLSGAVYVFVRTAGVWEQEAYLKASNTAAGDFFGQTLALSGNTLAVGAVGEDSAAVGVDGDQLGNGALESGAVYVLTRIGTTWSQQAYLKASNTGAGDFFGYAVALSGDTLAVGARYEASAATGLDGDQASNAATRSGAVYVLTRSGGVWSQEAYLKASNTGVGDQFGYSLALVGDTLAVGAFGEDSAATGLDGDQSNDALPDSGAVYVWTRSAGAWSQEAYLKASNTGESDFFGVSVALSASHLAVGAYHEDSAATGINGDERSLGESRSGAVYVLTRRAGAWSQLAYVKASNTGGSDFFGYAVALSANTLAVGGLGEDSGASGVDGDQSSEATHESGAVYVSRIAR